MSKDIKKIIPYTLLCIIMLMLCPLRGKAQSADSLLLHPDEDFVRAYIVVASPGEAIYSVAGHACLRLVCPAHNLDYIYSCEAEDISYHTARFLFGKLRMKVSSIPTAEYIEQYKAEGRGVKAYPINLPIAVKQQLWQQMDESVMQPDEPYDSINRGCSYVTFLALTNVIPIDSLQLSSLPEKYDRTRKEMIMDAVANPWYRFGIGFIVAGESESTDLNYAQRILLPTDLIEVLQQTKAYGRPLLSEEPEVLLEETLQIEQSWFTPLLLAILLLVIALANLRLHSSVVRWVFWSCQFVVSVMVTYHILSTMPCSQWNWLVIPFPPLTFLLWRWRRRWLLPYSALCVAWVIGQLIYPHHHYMPAHYIIVLAVAVSAVETYLIERKETNK